VNSFVQAIGFGLVTSAILALAAVAISLQVSVTNFINFAYGDFMTFGAYIAWTTNHWGLSFPLSLLIGAATTGLLGVAANLLVFRPFVRTKKVKPVALLIAGVGVSFIVQNGITMIWGVEPKRYSISLGRSLHFLGLSLTPGDLIIIISSAALLALLHITLRYTTFGKSLRATSNNTDLAQACGIDTDRVTTLTWFIAGVLTAGAGVGLALEETAMSPTLGFNELFVIFGAVIVGGIGRPYGAMLGALLVGVLTEVSGMYVDAGYKTSIAFGVVIIVLLFRPQGLFAASGKTS
jgi:branched-subunit amino acid ABC-type transport system permease component